MNIGFILQVLPYSPLRGGFRLYAGNLFDACQGCCSPADARVEQLSSSANRGSQGIGGVSGEVIDAGLDTKAGIF